MACLWQQVVVIWCMTHRKTTVDMAIEAMNNPDGKGGRANLARALGITWQAVFYWQRDGVVPLTRVLDVERLTGIPREALRPDVFGAPRPRPPKMTEAAA